MRLLHCETLELKEFTEGNIPRYAILSHTWDSEGEISLQEFISIDHVVLRRVKPKSFSKIDGFCQHVKYKYGQLGSLDTRIEYAWMDTICIDKTSSAELSEAINSMFRWYQGCRICIVFMTDVLNADVSNGVGRLHFESSRYWTRGWTLQELIAPEGPVMFFNQKWEELGTRDELIKSVSAASRVPAKVLRRNIGLYDCSVAQRMSWASSRETTRTEDMAYSLIGLFNINMPLLYGEGEKAFVRLQEEILKDSDDQTIFAWSDAEEFDASANFLDTRRQLELRGVLATHPRYFARSTGFCSKPVAYNDDLSQREIMSTNLGLRMNVPLLNCRYFIVAELSVIANVPSKPHSSRYNASWALPGNHLCIVLWPEPGGKGRLMRVMSTACILRSQLPSYYAATVPPSMRLLKSNYAGCNYVKTDFVIEMYNISDRVVKFGDCFYAPFPINSMTILEAAGKNKKWSFWESCNVGETVIVLKIHVPAIKLHVMDSIQNPHRGSFLLFVWLHPVIKCHCLIVPQPDRDDQYAEIMLEKLEYGLTIKEFMDVPNFGRVSFECHKSGIGAPAALMITGHS